MMDDILIHIANRSGLYGKFNSTTLSLAKELGMSQQTISRRLIELENLSLIKREVTTRGMTITLSEKSREELKKLSSVLNSIITKTNVIKGDVASGLGEGKYYISVYKTKIRDKLGYGPYPGTLNLAIDESQLKEFLQNKESYFIAEFKFNNRTFGAIYLYPIKIRDLSCAVLVPIRNHHKSDIIEIVSNKFLRRTFGLKDGDEVEIS